MDQIQDKIFIDLVRDALELKQGFEDALSRENYTKADAMSLLYGRHVEDIIAYNVNSIDGYQLKIQFFFESVLSEEGDTTTLAKCQKSLLCDLSKFKIVNALTWR